MSNINITIKSTMHEGRDVTRPTYRGLTANIKKDGQEPAQITDMEGINVVDFTEQALQQVIQGALANNDPTSHDVTITGAGLKKGMRTFISDKFTSDPTINAIKFL